MTAPDEAGAVDTEESTGLAIPVDSTCDETPATPLDASSILMGKQWIATVVVDLVVIIVFCYDDYSSRPWYTTVAHYYSW